MRVTVEHHDGEIAGPHVTIEYVSEEHGLWRWNVSAFRDAVFLAVRQPGEATDQVHLHCEDVDTLVAHWTVMRGTVYTHGPLATEVRDALTQARRELELRYPRAVPGAAAAEHDGYAEVRPRSTPPSNMEVFAAGLGAGVDPDHAARAAGGTGRPESEPAR